MFEYYSVFFLIFLNKKRRLLYRSNTNIVHLFYDIILPGRPSKIIVTINFSGVIRERGTTRARARDQVLSVKTSTGVRCWWFFNFLILFLNGPPTVPIKTCVLPPPPRIDWSNTFFNNRTGRGIIILWKKKTLPVGNILKLFRPGH